MPQKELSTIEFFKLHPTNPGDLRYVKRNFPTASMSKFYRECPNVALLWTALGNSAVLNNPFPYERTRQLTNAMNVFEREFYKDCLIQDLFIDNADTELDKRELRIWADRLRRYVVPVSTGVSR